MTAQETTPATNWIAGGSFSFSLQQNAQPISLIPYNGQVRIISSGNSDIRNTYFSFTPYVGKELNANWILGLQFVAGAVSWAVNIWEDKRMITARKLSFIKEIDGV